MQAVGVESLGAPLLPASDGQIGAAPRRTPFTEAKARSDALKRLAEAMVQEYADMGAYDNNERLDAVLHARLRQMLREIKEVQRQVKTLNGDLDALYRSGKITTEDRANLRLDPEIALANAEVPVLPPDESEQCFRVLSEECGNLLSRVRIVNQIFNTVRRDRGRLLGQLAEEGVDQHAQFEKIDANLQRGFAQARELRPELDRYNRRVCKSGLSGSQQGQLRINFRVPADLVQGES